MERTLNWLILAEHKALTNLSSMVKSLPSRDGSPVLLPCNPGCKWIIPPTNCDTGSPCGTTSSTCSISMGTTFATCGSVIERPCCNKLLIFRDDCDSANTWKGMERLTIAKPVAMDGKGLSARRPIAHTSQNARSYGSSSNA